jgi:hypothetical protein
MLAAPVMSLRTSLERKEAMDDAITLDNWSNTYTPNMNLALMGIPIDDPRRSEPGKSISTTSIKKVVRSTDGIFVQTRNTWYKLGTIDPAYVAFRALKGFTKDPQAALIDWAKDPMCAAEFEDLVS